MSALQVPFEREIILTQYYIEKKRLDTFLPKYKLRIEVDNVIIKEEILIMNKADN